MSLFEYVTVMVSMILALCLGHLLRSASFLASTDSDIKRYTPYWLWLAVILISVINQWWSIWDLSNIAWNYVSFLYILVAPILITFAIGLLSPMHNKSGLVDQEAHFDRVRYLFSGVMVTYLLFMWFDGPLFTEQKVFGPVGIMHIPVIMCTIIPGITKNYRLNVIGPASILVLLFGVMVIRYSMAISK